MGESPRGVGLCGLGTAAGQHPGQRQVCGCEFKGRLVSVLVYFSSGIFCTGTGAEQAELDLTTIIVLLGEFG